MTAATQRDHGITVSTEQGRCTQQPPAFAVVIVTGLSDARFAADAFLRRLWVSFFVRRQPVTRHYDTSATGR